MNETPDLPYIACLSLMLTARSEAITGARLEYAFHTFSLRNECAYTPTNDVTFGSPNPDSQDLRGAVERLVAAVLRVDVRASVLSSDGLRTLLDTHPNETEFVLDTGIIRSRTVLEDLYAQSLATHTHDH